ARIGDRLSGAMPPKAAAMILSYGDIYALRLQPGAQGLSYNELFGSYFRTLHRLGIPVDIVPPEADLSPYRLVVAPVLHLVKQAWADNLKQYVSQGGTLWVGARSGVKDDSNRVVGLPLPGLLSELCGVEVEEYDAIGRDNACSIAFEPCLKDAVHEGFTGHTWCDILAPADSTEVLARYASGYYAGKPALTRARRGCGSTFYLGTMVDSAGLLPLMAWLARTAGIDYLANLPDGIEVARRVRGDDTFLYILNHSDEERSAPIPGNMLDLITNVGVTEAITLAPYGVAILVPADRA
ncbi:MAG: beta-galactosidase trimerization domain-containing protein, partial [Chloroflexi bacterium]|nr:beta-galactosidase trimerization domain-containing protein [Chloroflexota bacterium]